MPKPWLKSWSKSLDKEKIAQLSGDQFKFWHYLLWIALRHDADGKLPDIKSIAFQSRCSVEEAEKRLEEQVQLKFVDKRGSHYVVHDWKHWQGDGMSDAERKKKQRDKEKQRDNEKECHVTCHDEVTEKIPRAKTQTKTEEGERKTSPTPSISIGPEYTQVGELAIELTGDLSWGSWVVNQGRIGHPADWIKRAIEQAAGTDKVKKPYVAEILRGYVEDGGPPAHEPSRSGDRSARKPEPDPPYFRMAKTREELGWTDYGIGSKA